MSTYTIRKNQEFESLEVLFPEKPAQQVIDALKGLGFRWHRVKRLWYGFVTENELTDAINNATREAEPKAVVIGGVVTDRYMGGGKWTGCNYEAHQYLSYCEINKRVKKELKRLYPDATFKTCGQSYSGGQSSILHIQIPGKKLFVEEETASQIFTDRSFHANWRQLYNGDVPASSATPEQVDEAFGIFYARLIANYEHGADNIKDYITPRSAGHFRHGQRFV